MRIFSYNKTYSFQTGGRKHGLTILEVLVVLGVMGLIAAVVFPQLSKIKENQVLKNGVQDVLSSINKARTQTLSSLDLSEYGVHFQADKVIIFKGTVFSPSDSNNEDINIISPASITDVQLGTGSPDTGDVYFNRLSANPSNTGTVTISTPSYSKIITISATGVASVN